MKIKNKPLQFIIIHTCLSSGKLYYTQVAVRRRKSTYRTAILYLSIARKDPVTAQCWCS